MFSVRQDSQIMAVKSLLFLLNFVSLLFICGSEGSEDVEVSCVLMESCVLPCSFQPGPDTIIHWIKTPEESFVHSYYNNLDQISHLNPNFKNRTSLFRDQFSTGNASLLLREVKIQDQSRYVCLTSTSRDSSDNSETFINLKVFVNIAEVTLEPEGFDLVCRSEGIYPKPYLTWSLSPQPETETEPNKAIVHQNEQQLYSISSSVSLSHSPPQGYSCNISTHHSWRSATYRLQPQINISKKRATIHCSAVKSPIKSLIWKFNHIQTILHQTEISEVYNKSWSPFVHKVSESGHLTLKNLSSDHQGVYTCHLSSDRETHISSTLLQTQDKSDSFLKHLLIEGGLVMFVLVFLAVWCYKKNQERAQGTFTLSKLDEQKQSIITGAKDPTLEPDTDENAEPLNQTEAPLSTKNK